jgi:hypothetical protein
MWDEGSGCDATGGGVVVGTRLPAVMPLVGIVLGIADGRGGELLLGTSSPLVGLKCGSVHRTDGRSGTGFCGRGFGGVYRRLGAGTVVLVVEELGGRLTGAGNPGVDAPAVPATAETARGTAASAINNGGLLVWRPLAGCLPLLGLFVVRRLPFRMLLPPRTAL